MKFDWLCVRHPKMEEERTNVFAQRMRMGALVSYILEVFMFFVWAIRHGINYFFNKKFTSHGMYNIRQGFLAASTVIMLIGRCTMRWESRKKINCNDFLSGFFHVLITFIISYGFHCLDPISEDHYWLFTFIFAQSMAQAMGSSLVSDWMSLLEQFCNWNVYAIENMMKQ